MNKFGSAMVISLGLFLLTACNKAEQAPSVVDAPEAVIELDQGIKWSNYLATFLDGYFKLNPGFAVYQGKHEFDGQLPDWSDQGLKAKIDYLKN